MRGKRRRERFCIWRYQQSPSTHTHTYPPLVLMAFFLFWSLHSRYPFFNTISQHITDIYPPPPHNNSSSSTLIITSPPPPPVSPNPSCFPCSPNRTEPKRVVLLSWWRQCVVCCTWCLFAPLLRLYIFHVVGLYIFFLPFLWGCGVGLRFCMDGWTDGGVDGGMGGGALGIFCMALGKVFVFHFMDGWVSGLVLAGFW